MTDGHWICLLGVAFVVAFGGFFGMRFADRERSERFRADKSEGSGARFHRGARGDKTNDAERRSKETNE